MPLNTEYKGSKYIEIMSKNIKSVGKNIIVKLEKHLEDQVEYGKLNLHIDPEFNPTGYTRIFGSVVAVPSVKPFYVPNVYNPEDKLYIKPEVEVGDKIYFHYMQSHNDVNHMEDNMINVPYEKAICVIREGKIKAISGWIIGEILYKGATESTEVLGHKIDALVSKSGLITATKKEPRKDVSRVVACSGYQDLPSEVKPGDLIRGEKGIHMTNNIEGKEYYCFLEENVLAIL
ncbi:MAG: co-chaperonin GroES (HSP10) [Arcticibacterium sp.]